MREAGAKPDILQLEFCSDNIILLLSWHLVGQLTKNSLTTS